MYEEEIVHAESSCIHRLAKIIVLSQSSGSSDRLDKVVSRNHDHLAKSVVARNHRVLAVCQGSLHEVVM